MKLKYKKTINLLDKNLNYTRTYLGGKKSNFFYINLKFLNGFKNEFSIFNSKETKLYLKKILKLIFEYNKKKKTILFLNFSNIKFLRLLNSKNHYCLPLNFVYLNIFFNKHQILYTLNYKILRKKSQKKKLAVIKFFNEIVNIKNYPDLIVLYGDERVKNNYINLIYKFKIPVIIFFNGSKKTNYNKFYKVPGNFQIIFEKYLYLIFKSLLKKNG